MTGYASEDGSPWREPATDSRLPAGVCSPLFTDALLCLTIVLGVLTLLAISRFRYGAGQVRASLLEMAAVSNLILLLVLGSAIESGRFGPALGNI